jgi:hypothetical protein
MIWDEQYQDHKLLDYYRRLIALRHTYAALRHGKRLTLPVEIVGASRKDDGQVGAYLRWLDTEYLVVVLNNGEHPTRVRMPLTGQLALAGIQAETPPILHDLLMPTDGQKITLVNGLVELELAALSAAILGPE